MKRIFLFIIVLVLISNGLCYSSELSTDSRGVKMQTFAADPSKSQVNSAMTGTITFKKGTGGTVNVSNWVIIKISPTSDSIYYFNVESTKTYPLRSDVDNVITLNNVAVGEYITVVLGTATASVQGM